ncbi:hypothetical protein LI328DRAFT_126493 [Trichoderma asperelloides]|nr:hypothetical protein LI328DRAFT_126493 [Trichoderma asperelloides]
MDTLHMAWYTVWPTRYRSSPDFSKLFTPPTRNVPGSQEMRRPISLFSNANSPVDKCRQTAASQPASHSSNVTMPSPTPALPTAFGQNVSHRPRR